MKRGTGMLNRSKGASALRVMAMSLIALAVSQANAQINIQDDTAAPGAIKLGPINITPTLGVANEYSSNIYSSETDEQSSNILVLEPAVNAVITDGANIYSLALGLSDGTYNSGSEDDYTDTFINADAVIAFNHRNILSLGASLTGNHEDRGSGLTEGTSDAAPEPTEYDEEFFTIGYQLGGDDATMRLVVNAETTDVEYTNLKQFTQFSNYESDGYDATVFYKIAPKTDIFLEYTVADYQYDIAQSAAQNLDSDEDSIKLGITWEATGNTTGTVKIGNTNKNFDSNSRKDISLTSWSAEIAWAPSAQTLVTLGTEQEPREINGFGDAIVATTYNVNWSQEWAKRLSSSVYLSSGEDDYEGTSRKDDLMAYGISFNYEFRRWFQIGVGYEYDDRDAGVAGRDYDRDIYIISVSLSL
jgi:hypothetical protein